MGARAVVAEGGFSKMYGDGSVEVVGRGQEISARAYGVYGIVRRFPGHEKEQDRGLFV